MGNTEAGGKTGKQTQIEKYGGEEGYHNEMVRRAKLASRPGTGGFYHTKYVKGDTETVKAMSKKALEKQHGDNDTRTMPSQKEL